MRPSFLERCCLNRLRGLSLKAVLSFAAVSMAMLFAVIGLLA